MYVGRGWKFSQGSEDTWRTPGPSSSTNTHLSESPGYKGGAMHADPTILTGGGVTPLPLIGNFSRLGCSFHPSTTAAHTGTLLLSTGHLRRSCELWWQKLSRTEKSHPPSWSLRKLQSCLPPTNLLPKRWNYGNCSDFDLGSDTCYQETPGSIQQLKPNQFWICNLWCWFTAQKEHPPSPSGRGVGKNSSFSGPAFPFQSQRVSLSWWLEFQGPL